ncbi:MAG: hypothetical protein ACK4PH_02710 [Aquincola tertiaricarbonis]
MNRPRFSSQATAFVLAAVVTLGMLAGVDSLATQGHAAQDGVLLVQQQQQQQQQPAEAKPAGPAA